MNDALTVAMYLGAGVALGYGLIIAARELLAGFNSAKVDFGSLDTEQDQVKEDHSKTEESKSRSKLWHEVLEVSPTASLHQIKAAYRAKIALYHPDKVAGLGEELRRLAEIHTKEINIAYAFACRLRG